jgi:hypothetical protein
VFDNEILAKSEELQDWKHERMSADIFDFIVDANNIDIDEDLQKTVKVRLNEVVCVLVLLLVVFFAQALRV